MNKKEISINNISVKRDFYIKLEEDSYDVIKQEYLLKPTEIDLLGKEIILNLYKYRNRLSVDFIIEQLTKLGGSPSLLYDDGGMFTIVSDGFQNVPEEGNNDMYFNFYVTADNWKPTIREAINYYLDKSFSELSENT
jgi:hypothetical protein